MKKSLIILAALAAASSAFAQSESVSGSSSAVQTAVQGNGIVTIENQAQPANSRTDWHGNTAASAGTVFVNPPAADTCARPGFGLSAQAVGGGVALSAPGVESEKCDMRADVLNLKVTGAPQEVVKARQCMDSKMAEAYARAGMPCRDMRPPTNAPLARRDGEGFASTDPYIAARMAARGQ